MRQILYISRAEPAGRLADVDGILEQSRHNNAIDGITGLLWTDRYRFLQVIEGPEESVTACFARIAADRRHCDIQIVLDRLIEAREFGAWSLHQRRADAWADRYDERMRRLLSSASLEVTGAIFDLVSMREAA